MAALTSEEGHEGSSNLVSQREPLRGIRFRMADRLGKAGKGILTKRSGRHGGSPARKIALAAVIVGLIASFWAFGLDRYFTLSYLKASSDTFRSLHAAHPVKMVLGYFLLYVLAISLSLPGAAVLTIGGGALFGLVEGAVAASFASSIGATICCLASRYLFRSWVQDRFKGSVARINEGIEREGAFYLFTLRLIPLFPFWMVNLAMGLTRMPLRRFYWVSQIGALPGTIVYVNAGRELATIDSLRGVLSPGLIASFVLIGVLPLGTKKLLALYRARRRRKVPPSDLCVFHNNCGKDVDNPPTDVV